MFTPEERSLIRSEIIEFARADFRITGCAITGSASAGREDEFSDIDIGFGVSSGTSLTEVADAFTSSLATNHEIADQFDIPIATWQIRVLWLANTLQIDLAFVPEEDFCAIGPSFDLQFGKCVERPHLPPPTFDYLVGWGWLNAIHVRSALARGKLWQAEYMVSGLRDTVLTLACLRHGLETTHQRGVHLLPTKDTEHIKGAIVRELSPSELARAFRVAAEGFLREVGIVDAERASRLTTPMLELF